jgi:maltose/maltodextrin transport system substrate-binding protein
MKRFLLVLLILFLVPVHLRAWTSGELLIWMDADRSHGLAPIAKKFESDFGIKVKIETPEKITDSFPIAAQAGKGPDIVIWAHDKLGEWADAGLIAPVEVSDELVNKFFRKSWQAVFHHKWIWGYPIALETITLIYNKQLLDGPPPTPQKCKCLVNGYLEKCQNALALHFGQIGAKLTAKQKAFVLKSRFDLLQCFKAPNHLCPIAL